MWANNETGVLFPIEEIAAICQRKQAIFHTDAVQAVGKVPIDLGSGAIQFLSLSGHKLHAPKGVGVLYVNRRARFNPFLIGGSQEEKRRGGTHNTASIVGLGKAAELAAQHLAEENTRGKNMRGRLEQEGIARISWTRIQRDPDCPRPSTPH